MLFAGYFDYDVCPMNRLINLVPPHLLYDLNIRH